MLIRNSKECPNCGSNHKSRPFCVYANGYFCFSCGKGKNSDRNFLTINKLESKTIELPEYEDNPDNFSLVSLEWLYKYYVYPSLIRQYKIVEASGPSLIFPVIKGDYAVMYQRRWMTEQRKILTTGSKVPLIANPSDNRTIVLVEDFLSAIRVGEVLTAMCLFGTSTGYDNLVELVNNYDHIIIWLDGDKPGQEGGKKLEQQLLSIINRHVKTRAFAVREPKTIKKLFTERDPKCYTKHEIRTILELNSETKIINNTTNS